MELIDLCTVPVTVHKVLVNSSEVVKTCIHPVDWMNACLARSGNSRSLKNAAIKIFVNSASTIPEKNHVFPHI